MALLCCLIKAFYTEAYRGRQRPQMRGTIELLHLLTDGLYMIEWQSYRDDDATHTHLDLRLTRSMRKLHGSTVGAAVGF